MSITIETVVTKYKKICAHIKYTKENFPHILSNFKQNKISLKYGEISSNFCYHWNFKNRNFKYQEANTCHKKQSEIMILNHFSTNYKYINITVNFCSHLMSHFTVQTFYYKNDYLFL